MITRRDFIKLGGASAAAVLLSSKFGFIQKAFAEYVANNTLDPSSISKFVSPLVIPPAMPRSSKINVMRGKNIEYYNIAVRQFGQQILPAVDGFGPTTVWSYGSVDFPGTVGQGGSFNYPAFTIEAKWTKPVRVNWINDLVDQGGNFLPHLLPVDPTLHWANPIGERDMRPEADSDYWDHPYLQGQNGSYTGPVPLVTHVHGAHVIQDSDGYPEAWYLPAAAGMNVNYDWGTYYDQYAAEFKARTGQPWTPGTAVFEYPNDMLATTLWYHDHTLGMTRLNVYAGPAGFWIIRGGPGDVVTNLRGRTAVLPGPAPALGDPPGLTYYEIPIVFQDRSFANPDHTSSGRPDLWYPNYRAFFEGLGDVPDFLKIPFTPSQTLGGAYSDVAPIWQPEFFGNVMVVNGVSWPKLQVEQQQYRFRLLNGCNSRFLILNFGEIPGVKVWQIGADGGFLPAPVDITASGNKILMGLAERADVIVDFRGVDPGEYILGNLGPDEPFGGDPVDEDSPPMPEMRQVMRFDVVSRGNKSPKANAFTEVDQLVLPAVTPLVATAPPRQLSLNEDMSHSVFVPFDADADEFVLDTNGTLWEVFEDEEPYQSGGVWKLLNRLPEVTWARNWKPDVFGPTSALLGTMVEDENGDPKGVPLLWMAPVTENPALGDTEVWEIYNMTVDAHPIHIHLVQFQVVGREVIGDSTATSVAGSNDPLPTETGFKDTVIAYPGEITRVIAHFDTPGRFVWHCHIVEHEDNEMMRPYDIV